MNCFSSLPTHVPPTQKACFFVALLTSVAKIKISRKEIPTAPGMDYAKSNFIFLSSRPAMMLMGLQIVRFWQYKRPHLYEIVPNIESERKSRF